MKQHFKGVVWPRESQKAKVNINGVKSTKKVYRYVVVGMVITDQPVVEFEGKNEIFIDSPVSNLIDPLTKAKSRKPSYKIGDADSLLTELNDL